MLLVFRCIGEIKKKSKQNFSHYPPYRLVASLLPSGLQGSHHYPLHPVRYPFKIYIKPNQIKMYRTHLYIREWTFWVTVEGSKYIIFPGVLVVAIGSARSWRCLDQYLEVRVDCVYIYRVESQVQTVELGKLAGIICICLKAQRAEDRNPLFIQFSKYIYIYVLGISRPWLYKARGWIEGAMP